MHANKVINHSTQHLIFERKKKKNKTKQVSCVVNRTNESYIYIGCLYDFSYDLFSCLRCSKLLKYHFITYLLTVC